MNQGRIWCVVNPTIGLPAFLGSVALISFTVHFAVLENTDWMKRYWQGAEAGAPAAASAATPMTAANGYTVRVTPSGASGAIKVDVTPAEGDAQAMASPSPTSAPPGSG